MKNSQFNCDKQRNSSSEKTKFFIFNLIKKNRNVMTQPYIYIYRETTKLEHCDRNKTKQNKKTQLMTF